MTAAPESSAPRKSWLRAAALVAAIYFVLGMILLNLAGRVDATHARAGVRQAFTLVAILVGIAHGRHEVVVLKSRPSLAALHVAFAVAVTACVFAIKAVVSQPAGSSNALLGASIVIWPVIAGGAAFLGTFALASLWKKTRHS